MKKNLIAKGLTVGAIFLIITIALTPSINVSISKQSKERIENISTGGNTLYVGGDGPGNYSSIQDAIDNASNGDTVYVYNGTYYEQVRIDKSVQLIGEDRETTIIDSYGCDDIVTITADNVTLIGFTVRNTTCFFGFYYYAVKSMSENNTIENNIISNNVYAMAISTSNNIVSNNIIINNNHGINAGASNNTIVGNTFINDDLLLTGSYNTIMYNDFEMMGISLEGQISDWNTYVIEENTVNGKPLRYYKNTQDIIVPSDTGQVILANCSNVTISNLSISDLNIGILYGGCSNVTVTQSHIQNTYNFGIAQYSSSNCNISDNNLTETFGIHISGSYNTISGNYIGDSYYNGILIECGSYNIISENSIINSYYGIQLKRDSSNNTILENVIIDSASYGIYLLNSDYTRVIGNTLRIIDIVYINNKPGIYLKQSHLNNITENIFENYDGGIHLTLSMINNISYNTMTAYPTSYYINSGIMIECSIYNNIFENTISQNWDYGFLLTGATSLCNIFRNTISENDIGFGFGNASNNCIYENTIENNEQGIRITQTMYGPSNNNLIYHNIFCNNSIHAYDTCTNQWDNGYPSGGNYWDDYTGEDNNSDGIGDVPYNISGGSNQDLYPLMNPWGENPPVANFSYEIDSATVTFDASSSYDRDGDIATWLWDFGDGVEGAGIIVNHVYSEPRTFEVTLTVIDDDGYEGQITKSIEIEDVYEFETALIIGKITNPNAEGEYITFEAERLRYITFAPFSFNLYTSGELITISKDYIGWVGERFIFALCDASI